MLYLPIGWFCSLSKSPCFCPIQDFTDFSDESNGFRQFRHSPWQFDHHCQNYIHPWNLTWNLKITCLKRKLIFQTFIFGFHVNFQGCNGMFDNSSNQNGINLDSDMIHPVLHQHKSDDFSPSLAASFPSGRPGPLLGLFVEEPRQRSYGGGRKTPVFVGRRNR